MLFPKLVTARAPAPRRLLLGPAMLALALGSPHLALGADEKPTVTVVSKGKDAASKLVNNWFAEGKAAGLEGVYYDNRDRGHSKLGIANYPQLKPIIYTEAELQRRADWGARGQLLRGKVVIGNSSTASPATQSGSHQRMYYTNPQGLRFLYAQYRTNALYVYPEHRDHDPGINGPDGFGDLYSANSPYLISSQGSSGSDRVFMFAMLKTIAAFPPATREALVSKGLLMPALQAIFRQTYKASSGPDDYFTGKAHPSAFDGKLIDEVAMVRLAQAMHPAALPPLVILRVTDEDKTTLGRDFFEPDSVRMTAGQPAADSPCSISRIFRGKNYRHTLRLSASDSISPQDLPLKFRWVVLRGDPGLISIEPHGENAEEATLSVAWQPRRPIAPGSAMVSNRIDIGVFAEAEGCLASPPSFISFTTLPNEHRTYTGDGRLLEIFYAARSRRLDIPSPTDGRWETLLSRFDVAPDKRSPDTKLLAAVMKTDQVTALVAAASATKETRAQIAVANGKLDVIVAAQQEVINTTNKVRRAAVDQHKKLATDETQAALAASNKDYRVAKKTLTDGADGAAELKTEIAGLRAKVAATLRGGAIPECVGSALETIRSDFRFASENATSIRAAAEQSPNAKAKNALKAALGRLAFVAVAAAGSDPPPLNDRYHFEQLNLDILTEVLFPDFLQRTSGPNFFDRRLTSSKNWRDVYHYDGEGAPLGWTRYQNGKPSEFTADGDLVLSRTDKGTPDKVAKVLYQIDPQSKQLKAVEVK